VTSEHPASKVTGGALQRFGVPGVGFEADADGPRSEATPARVDAAGGADVDEHEGLVPKFRFTQDGID
jgi:hypothetical protein